MGSWNHPPLGMGLSWLHVLTAPLDPVHQGLQARSSNRICAISQHLPPHWPYCLRAGMAVGAACSEAVQEAQLQRLSSGLGMPRENMTLMGCTFRAALLAPSTAEPPPAPTPDPQGRHLLQVRAHDWESDGLGPASSVLLADRHVGAAQHSLHHVCSTGIIALMLKVLYVNDICVMH